MIAEGAQEEGFSAFSGSSAGILDSGSPVVFAFCARRRGNRIRVNLKLFLHRRAVYIIKESYKKEKFF